jgi:hypothetical protein
MMVGRASQGAVINKLTGDGKQVEGSKGGGKDGGGDKVTQ